MKNLQKKITAWLLMFSLVFCMMPVNVWASDVDFSEVEATESVAADTTDSDPEGTETIDEPTVDEPTVDEPAVDEPTVDEPTVDEPTVDEPTVDEPTVDEPTVDEPTVDEPTVDEPTVDEPTVDEPTVDEPTVDEPTVDEPTVDEPAVDEPTVEEPIVEEEPIVSDTTISEPKPEPQPEQKPVVDVPPVQLDVPPVQATMPQPEIIAPIVIPAEVTTFLQSVDELTAAWNELQARMESGLELDFTAELEALNDLGVAAMDAYEAVQAADLESLDGVEIALEQLMIVTEEITGGANLLALISGEKFTVNVVKVVNGNIVDSATLTQKCLQSTGHAGYNHSTNLRTLANESGFSGYKGYNWSQYTTVPSNYTKGLAPNNNYAPVHYNITGSAPYKADETLFLFFEDSKTFTLKYNPNGGSGAPATQTATSTATSHNFTISNTEPTRSGYEFLGWSTSSTATNPSYCPGGTINVTGTTTLYAVWKKNSEQVTLTYNANGGTNPPAPDTKNKGSYFTIKNKGNMTYDGYEFLGWSTDKTATEADIAPGDEMKLNENTILFAVWKKNGPTQPNRTFTLKKVFEGLEEIPADFSLEYTVKSGTNTATETFNVSNAASVDENKLIVIWEAPYFYNMESSNEITIVENADVNGYTYTAEVNVGEAKGNTITFKIAPMFSGGNRTITNTYTKDVVEKPALTLTKTADQTKVKPGEIVNYTITVKNTGNAEATSVTITDVLPGELTFVSANLNGEAITPAEGVYTVGDLASDANATLIITATVNDDVEAGTEISNTAIADYEGKPDDENPSDEAKITVIDKVEKITVRIKKVFDGITEAEIPDNFKLTWVAGTDNGELTLDTGNSTNDGLTYTWEIKMVEDETLTLTESGAEISGKNLIVSAKANKSWIKATLNGKDIATPDSTKTATSSNSDNSGVVGQADGYDVTDSDSSSVTVVIPAEPYVTVTNSYESDNGKGIEITKTRKDINGDENATTAKVGDKITWNIVVKNNSNVQKTVKLTEMLPGTTLSMDTVTLAAGASETVTAEYVVTLKDYENVGHKLFNTVKGQTDKPDEEKTTTDEGTEVEEPYSITKIGAEKVQVGSEFTYIITVKNNTNEELKNFTITDVLPNGITFVSAAFDDETITPVDGVYTIASLAAGAEGKLEIKVKAATVGTVTNTATLTVGDKTYDDTAKTEITDKPVTTTNLSVSKKADKQTVKPGEQVTYKITVTNNGSITANDVVITDNLPEGLEFVSANLSGDNGQYSVGDLAAGASATLTITAKVAADVAAGTEIENVATAKGDNTTGNPWDSEKITVSETKTSLEVSKEANRQTVKAGEQVIYTITVKNTGKAAATNVKLTDKLDSRLTLVKAEVAGVEITPVDNVYSLGDIAVNGNVVLSIIAKVADTVAAGTVIENVATATFENPAENSGELTGKATVTVTEDKKPVEYTLTVKYVDEDGKEIKTTTTTTKNEGTEYSVTSEDIDGYEYVGPSAESDALKGTMNSDKTVILVYEKTEENPPVGPNEPVNPPVDPNEPTTPEDPATPDDGGSGDDSSSGDDDSSSGDDNSGADEPAPVPVATIDEENTPLTEAPVEEVIFDEAVPLAETPDEEETLLDDEDVPLAKVPKTGDNLLLWFFAAVASAIGALSLGRKRD